MPTKEEAYIEIENLVKRFTEQYDSYKKAEYNETLTRRDFIDPFFKALGWDVDNKNNYAEAYREVIHEDRVRVGKATKAPDYSFKLSGSKRLFFVEAKKPNVVVKDEIQPAYQLRRYGWSAKLPISIITDFEEFAVYDCTKKPKPNDRASVARIKYLTYKDYLTKFDFIWNTFSKENVLKGSFDKFIQSDTYKKGTATVDKEFLQSLDNWRTYLASSISKNNKQLDEDEINFVVQQTIDRIIFLRIAEDRSVEPYGVLKETIKNGDFYKNLFQLFIQADEKYNSGLFDFTKDKISKGLVIENKILKTIITELYYPECPYEFSVLSVEMLGSAYEQFLGKVIRITSGHNAKVEEKPEARKAGGVYYTPQIIVDYIVQNTVGKLIENKTPKEVSKIKIVDPACGSGSFLLGAYQYLLDWHKNYYTQNGKPSKGNKENPLTPLGELTTAEKKRILLNNIYGVDIDVNAVEVTKLSLLLKCLEGETEASIATQLRLFNDRILPTLDNNIKAGNSLIDIDYYDNELDFGEDKKIKPFSWQKAFPEVFNRKVIVDEQLPYKKQYEKVKIFYEETESLLKQLKAEEPTALYKKYFNAGFDIVIGNPPYVQPTILEKKVQTYLSNTYIANTDLYSIFIERCLRLIMEECSIGFIVPSLFIKGVRYQRLRDIINDNCSEVKIVEQGDKVFGKVKMPTCIILLTKGKNLFRVNYFKNNNTKIFEKVSILKLYEIAEIKRGLEIGRDMLKDKASVKCLSGSCIDNYVIKEDKFITKETYKLFSKNSIIFQSPKILVRASGSKFFATIDYENCITTRSIYNTKIINKNFSVELILGIINSSLFRFYFKQFIAPDTNIFPKLRIAQLKELPIPKAINNLLKQKIEKLVEQILQLNKEKLETRLDSKSEQLQTRIDYCEDKINELVYQLYNLSDDEIKIVEEIDIN